MHWPAFNRRWKGNMVSFGLLARLLAYFQRSPLSPLQSVGLVKKGRELEAKKNNFFRNLRDLTNSPRSSNFKIAPLSDLYSLFWVWEEERKSEKIKPDEIGKSRGLRLTSSYTRRSFAFVALLPHRTMDHHGVSFLCDPERRPPLNALTSSDRLVGSAFCRIPEAL